MYNKFSFFNAPIKPYTGKYGIRYSAQTAPTCEMDVLATWTMIRSNDVLRNLTCRLRSMESEAERREFKATQFPFVTPCGTFTRRAAGQVASLSGLVVLDIDHLADLNEANRVRDLLFDDPVLQPSLAFVSPSGQGVKLFVPYVFDLVHSVGCYSREEFDERGSKPTAENLRTVSEQILFGMDYLNLKLQISGDKKLTRKQMECDFSGKDVSRACFLGFDPDARQR